MTCRFFVRSQKNLLLSGLMLLLAFSACSRQPRSSVPRSVVTITIKQQGAPLTAGVVDIVNLKTGEGASESLNELGTVKLTGISHGEYAVTVQPPGIYAPDGSMQGRVKDFKLDPKYAAAETSPLSIQIDAQNKTFELEVE